MKWLWRIGAGVLALGLLIVLAVAGLVWASMPGGDLNAAIPGLLGRVSITLDDDAIPRIAAGSDIDAAAALGFLHARERLFQMDLMRRAAGGELSELLGSFTLGNDRLMRVLGVRRSAQADLPLQTPEARALLDAYARGVNAWIDRRGRFAAMEYFFTGPPRRWTPVDSLLWAKTMGLYLSGNWRTELARLRAPAGKIPVLDLWPGAGGGHPEARFSPALADTATRLAAIIPTFPAPFTLPATASDEWAVDGAHSTTGAPLLAGDPHLSFGLPGIWYLARIETPDHLLVGATAPGMPFLVIGHNGHIAWTFTTTGADVQDIFIETAIGPDQYATPNGPCFLTTRPETIHVRGAPDETLIVRETRHGPVISDLINPNGPLLALAMGNLAPGDTAASGITALNRAENLDAAMLASGQISSPVQNLLIADHDNIGLAVTGRIPIRRAGDGSVPVDGADGAHDWLGFANGTQLPRYRNPASGRLINGNEAIAPPDFPVFLGRDNFADWRARRIRALLAAKPKHSVADFVAMQTDTGNVFATDILPALRATPAPPGLPAKALLLLRDWDGRMDAALPQPLIFQAWTHDIAQRLLQSFGLPAAAAAPEAELVAHALSSQGAGWCNGDCRPLLATSLQSAVAALAQRFGDDPAAWRWGAVHQAVFAHPLEARIPGLAHFAQASVPSGGGDTSLLRAAMAPGSFDAIHGAALRAVFDLADLEHSRFVIAPGQSGHVLSALRLNFLARWQHGETIMLQHHPNRVATRITLTP